MTGNIETKTWFNNKQVITLVGFSIVSTFFVSGYVFTFDDNDKRLDEIEALHIKDNELLEKAHEREIGNLKEEMKIIGKFFQEQLNDIKEDGKRRTNTIRDRTDDRLDKLEERGSDKN